MCRKCGEPDGRGPAWQRRARKRWLLSPASLWGGDGEKVECWNVEVCGAVLTFETMEVDRIIPGWQCRQCGTPAGDHGSFDRAHEFRGGTYRQNNIRPSCGPCNRARNKGNPWGIRVAAGEIRCMTR